MKILLLGQCTLHVGRMEYGNIGNYYIMEPFIRELHKVFPQAEIRTTFQMSDSFCNKEQVTRLPMSLYYGWSDYDLSTALMEFGIATTFNKIKKLVTTTPYIDEVMDCDLIIDFSGDIWGDNANFLGINRFLVGLYKNRIAQLLGKKVVMLAGSPGPFTDETTKDFAKEVFANFDLVTNRESISRRLLEQDGFDVNRVIDLACPAFLFEPASRDGIEELLEKEGVKKSNKPLVGFVLCGWNFTTGPFDKWPRDDEDYLPFVKTIEYLIKEFDVRVCLLSHSNGFNLPAPPFNLIHGRDYPVIKQLQSLCIKPDIEDNVLALDGIYDAWQTKAIIGGFDMLISGRIHAAVAGLSQSVPTVIIDYGHEPKAHKLKGFAEVAGVEQFVADPVDEQDLIRKVQECWSRRMQIRQHLKTRIPEVKKLACANFELLRQIVEE